MGERTSYVPGTFCWADLATTDPAAAIAFYSTLFGWEPDEAPDTGGYTLMRLHGAAAAAIHGMQTETPALPAWLSWVSVEDAGAVAGRAVALGGAVAAGPMDVMDLGRMATIADPQGAVVGLWQPGEFPGAGRVNEIGAMTMNQLNTPDPKAGARFHSELFGWEFTQIAPEPTPFWSVTNSGTLNGGMMTLAPPAPPHWLAYFTVEDIDGADALIVDMGGAVVTGPLEVPAGRFLVARDPQYAYFAIFQGDVDP